ncbi:alpha/beta hydrolase [Streptomyces sp. CHD11]|uniref:esterase/lipase family protein n=1 Tax=Streptomyces sp. CHD11 TaxID=2741325 RepID=UPI001BFC206A|nr:alpha/beta hydrolase [Streptomyces sp. CHD11]MBT3150106.1 alpha/beta hydrolase [Streptomyces sp. CHD11]
MAIAFAAAAPANAAPKRSNGRSAVIFVHGFDGTGAAATNCQEYWASAINYFQSKKYTNAQLRTYSYYPKKSGSNGCTWRYTNSDGKYGSRRTSLTAIAKNFANRVYNSYSSAPSGGQKVDVVARSMGGLVVRSALYHVKKGTAGFPPYLYIEDVVTLGSPHDGASGVQLALCKAAYNSPQQCKQMTKGSSFLKGLPQTPSKSAMGTDWTAISSHDDSTVSGNSGAWINAQHKAQFDGSGDNQISHTALKSHKNGTFRARVKDGGAWSSYGQRVAPVVMAHKAVLNRSEY